MVIAQDINFTGSWQIIKGKSNFGVVSTLVIFDKMDIDQTRHSIFLKFPAVVSYPLNGKKQERIYQDTIKLAGFFLG